MTILGGWLDEFSEWHAAMLREADALRVTSAYRLPRERVGGELVAKLTGCLRVPEELVRRCEMPWVGDVRIATAPTSGTVRYVPVTVEVPQALMLLAEGAPLLRRPARV